MPEMPKWLIILIISVCGIWFLSQAVDFMSKIGKTVNNANKGIENQQQDLKQVKGYY